MKQLSHFQIQHKSCFHNSGRPGSRLIKKGKKFLFINIQESNRTVRRVTAMRTTSSGIHIRSDDDEKKIFFPHPEAFVRVWGTAGKAERFSFDVLSSLQALSHHPPPPPPRPPSRSQNVPYRCRPALAAHVRQKKKKRKQEENENNQWKKNKKCFFSLLLELTGRSTW